MNVFIVNKDDENTNSYAKGLKSFLENEGHHVFATVDDFPSVQDFAAVAVNEMRKSDVNILLLSESIDLPDVSKLLFFQDIKAPKQLVIYVLLKNSIEVPRYPTGQWQMTISADDEIPEKDYEKISLGIKSYQLAKAQDEKEQKEKEEKVQTGLSNYLNDTMTRLKENEARNMILSYVLYVLSLAPLAVSIVIALRTSIANAENTIAMAVQAIIAFFVILLFVSMSKLLFTLAKSFMVESIRCSDRIHAISFGKFFLDAYGNDATREEVLKAFNTWNIDDGKTSFRNQSGDDYDPKLENIIAAVKDVYKSK